MPSKFKNVFISHHHKDDGHVDKLSSLLKRRSFSIRNSSIRAKPANQRRLDEKRVPERTLKRLLRMKISWAGTTIVLVGKDTHKRPWVSWEISKANELGKRIVGVFTHGGSEADIPAELEKYGDAIVKWNSNSLIDAIEGRENRFENSLTGRSRNPVHTSTRSQC